MASPTNLFNCGRCPAYCCSYPIIEVTKKDLRQLASHFDVPVKQAKKEFSEKAAGRKKAGYSPPQGRTLWISLPIPRSQEKSLLDLCGAAKDLQRLSRNPALWLL